MERNPDKFDPRFYITPIMNVLITGTENNDKDIKDIEDCFARGVKEVVGSLIVEFGSVGHAPQIKEASLK